MPGVKVLNHLYRSCLKKNLQQNIIIRARWRIQVMTNRACCVTQDKIRQLDFLVTWGQRTVGQAGRPLKTPLGWNKHLCWKGNEYKRPNPLAVSLVWGRSLVGIAGSNPARNIDVYHLWVLWSTGLCVGLLTRSEVSYQVWCVWVWSWSLDHEEVLARLGPLHPRRGGNTKETINTCWPVLSAVHDMHTVTFSLPKPIILHPYMREQSIRFPAILSSSFVVWFETTYNLWVWELIVNHCWWYLGSFYENGNTIFDVQWISVWNSSQKLEVTFGVCWRQMP